MRDRPKGSRTWGYARVSTEDQDLALQIAALERFGVDGIFKEKASGKDMERAALKWMMHEIYLRPGDTVVVWKLDRLGRSLHGLIELVQAIEDRGANLISLTDHIDTGTATGRFFFHIIAAMAEWERNMISERTKAGLAAFKAKGGRMGPKRKIEDNPKRMTRLRRLDAQGKLRDDEGNLLMQRSDILHHINSADPDAPPIESEMTVKRWQDAGFPGLSDK